MTHVNIIVIFQNGIRAAESQNYDFSGMNIP